MPLGMVMLAIVAPPAPRGRSVRSPTGVSLDGLKASLTKAVSVKP
jgi:hypothetical protein